MTEDHLEAGLLAAVARGEIEVRVLVRRLVRHLLALCPECHRAWDRAVQAWREVDPATATAAYNQAFARVLTRLEGEEPDLRRERAEAPALVAELAALPEAQQEAVLREDRRFHCWGVADLLIHESHQAAFEDPGIAQTLARLAVFVAGKLDPVTYGAAFRNDVLGIAWAYLGNARRVASDLRGAEAALTAAREHLAEGVGDPLTRAQVANLEASLRRAQRRFTDAEDLLDEVIAIYRQVGDLHMEGRTLVQQAAGLQFEARLAEAISLLRRALTLIDEEVDPRLLLCAHHNLAICLVEDGQLAEAEAVVAASRSLYEGFSDFSTRLRLRWLEGRFAAGHGRFPEAEAAFAEVRQGFIDREVGYDAALASLDLAALYAEQGRTGDVRRLAEEMLPIFRSRDVHREAMAALLIFQQAARAEEITVRMVEQVAAYLRQARHNPSLRYEEPS